MLGNHKYPITKSALNECQLSSSGCSVGPNGAGKPNECNAGNEEAFGFLKVAFIFLMRIKPFYAD